MPTTLPIDDIIWACTNLCDLIEYENQALALHDTQSVRDLAANKAQLARIYEQSVAPMADNPHLLDQVEPELRQELLALGNRLQSLMDENAMRLKAEMEAYQTLMDAVVSAVKTTSTEKVSYGPAGQFRPSATGEKNSLAYNKTL